jgi:hypothetical protein
MGSEHSSVHSGPNGNWRPDTPPAVVSRGLAGTLRRPRTSRRATARRGRVVRHAHHHVAVVVEHGAWGVALVHGIGWRNGGSWQPRGPPATPIRDDVPEVWIISGTGTCQTRFAWSSTSTYGGMTAG